MYAIRSYYDEERYKHITKYDNIPFYKTVKKYLRKLVKKKQISRLDYYRGEMCPDRIAMLNNRITSYNVCYTKLLRFYHG